MSLPILGSDDQPFQQLQTQWAGILNPLIKIVKAWNSKPPQVTVVSAPGNGLFRTPEGTFYIEVELIGAGGGGGGSSTDGSSGTDGGNGGDSTFGANFLIARGGAGGLKGGTLQGGGAGGGAILGNAIGLALPGMAGENASSNITSETSKGGTGGVNIRGGAGVGGAGANAGSNAGANTGAGGGGAGGPGSGYSASGGGAGGSVRTRIAENIQASYSYTVGSGGAVGTAGTGGTAGGRGADGGLMITVYFQ